MLQRCSNQDIRHVSRISNQYFKRKKNQKHQGTDFFILNKIANIKNQIHQKQSQIRIFILLQYTQLEKTRSNGLYSIFSRMLDGIYCTPNPSEHIKHYTPPFLLKIRRKEKYTKVKKIRNQFEEIPQVQKNEPLLH